jgi:hypothetical protein
MRLRLPAAAPLLAWLGLFPLAAGVLAGDDATQSTTLVGRVHSVLDFSPVDGPAYVWLQGSGGTLVLLAVPTPDSLAPPGRWEVLQVARGLKVGHLVRVSGVGSRLKDQRDREYLYLRPDHIALTSPVPGPSAQEIGVAGPDSVLTHLEAFQVYSRIRLRSSPGSVLAEIDSSSLRTISVPVSNGMITAWKSRSYYFRGSSPGWVSDGFAGMHDMIGPGGFPSRAQALADSVGQVQLIMDAILFESDVPQHDAWDLPSWNYRELWRGIVTGEIQGRVASPNTVLQPPAPREGHR